MKVDFRLSVICVDFFSGVTELTLLQTGVPNKDQYGNPGVLESTKQGWNENIFTKLKKVLGYMI